MYVLENSRQDKDYIYGTFLSFMELDRFSQCGYLLMCSLVNNYFNIHLTSLTGPVSWCLHAYNKETEYNSSQIIYFNNTEITIMNVNFILLYYVSPSTLIIIKITELKSP